MGVDLVFERYWYAMHRATGVALGNLLFSPPCSIQGRIGRHGYKGAELTVQRLDTFQVSLGRFHGRDFLGGHQSR